MSLPNTLLPTLGLMLLALPGAAEAAKCKGQGNLLFLGKTHDLSRSVWLSGTNKGAFNLLEPNNSVVDAWQRDRRGLHLSLSPVVSQGSGLPHTLVDVSGDPCELDMENQKGGIVFPPLVQLPPKLPPIFKPPSNRPSPPGVMPTRPSRPGGSTTPPIATLPPSTGLMPSRPSAPSLPGGTTPPVATLPPSGILPPAGLTPSLPSAPSLPGGTTPPIATLPPSGTLPPAGLTPSLPTVPGTPGVTPPPEGVQPSPPGTLQPSGALPALDGTGADGQVPLTEGRRFQQEPLWNFWVDSRYNDVSDRRSGLDLEGHSGYLTLGADRRLDADLVVGLMGIAERTRSDGFGDTWQVRSDGYSAGPYLAYRLSPTWAMDLSLTAGQLDNDNRVLVLRERFDTQRYALSTSLSGQYLLGETLLNPKLSLSYSHFRNEAHQMRGQLFGIPLRLEIEEQNYDYGVAEASLQISRAFHSSAGRYWLPYVEAGLSNEFERPNDGRILTGDLSQEKTSPWSGNLRGGVLAQLADNAVVDASLGYLSLGQNGLDIWEGRIFISVGF